MAELKAGDKLRDNDPRMAHRILTVTEVTQDQVMAEDRHGRPFTYARKRVFTDSRKRRYGLSRVIEAA